MTGLAAPSRTRRTGFTPTATNAEAIERYWSEQTETPAPERRFILGWLLSPMDEIKALIDDLGRLVRRGDMASGSAGRIMSAELGRRRRAVNF
jgi:hypothetical protein